MITKKNNRLFKCVALKRAPTYDGGGVARTSELRVYWLEVVRTECSLDIEELVKLVIIMEKVNMVVV